MLDKSNTKVCKLRAQGSDSEVRWVWGQRRYPALSVDQNTKKSRDNGDGEVGIKTEKQKETHF